MLHRIVNNLVSVQTQVLIPITTARGSTRGYMVIFARTLVYQKSYYPDTIRLWNVLPEQIASCTDADVFNKQLQSENLRLITTVFSQHCIMLWINWW